jgi:streptogramin lyase
MTADQEGSAFIAQITSQGQATWAKVVPGKGMADDVAVGVDGKVHVVGQFANDEILYSYDPAADALTARKTVAGNATDNGLRTHSVAVSTSGTVWLSGTFKGTINLGTGALSTSSVAAFLMKLN